MLPFGWFSDFMPSIFLLRTKTNKQKAQSLKQILFSKFFLTQNGTIHCFAGSVGGGVALANSGKLVNQTHKK